MPGTHPGPYAAELDQKEWQRIWTKTHKNFSKWQGHLNEDGEEFCQHHGKENYGQTQMPWDQRPWTSMACGCLERTMQRICCNKCVCFLLMPHLLAISSYHYLEHGFNNSGFRSLSPSNSSFWVIDLVSQYFCSKISEGFVPVHLSSQTTQHILVQPVVPPLSYECRRCWDWTDNGGLVWFLTNS